MKTTLVAGLLSLALLPPLYMGVAYPVNAQETQCVTIADAEKQVEDAGAKIVGGASYAGKNSDEVLVVQGPTTIALFFFKGGCLVTGFVADEAVPETGV